MPDRNILILFVLSIFPIITFSQDIKSILDKNLISYSDFTHSDSIQSKVSRFFKDKKVFFVAETHEMVLHS